MVNSLSGQTVVVIGGTSGIGYQVAKLVLETTQANVVISSSNQSRVDKAEKALREIGHGRVRAYVLDVAKPETLGEKATAFFDQVGSFNHLVWTAGDSLAFMKIEQFNREEASKVFNIRYWALQDVIRVALPHMPSSKDSSISFTSATIGQRPTPGWVLVGSGISGALISLARGLAIDLAPVRVNVVAPGVVDTELWGWLEEDARKGLFEEYGKKFPVGSVGKPEEVAEAYLFFMRCGYVTGQTITVDGGSVLV
jgi:NAD(P)-dependent dehydrogenase (short-subunit alcohol dehydrogenase family)